MKNAHSPSCICALSTKLFLFAAAFGRPAFAVGEWRLLLQLRALKTITLLGAARPLKQDGLWRAEWDEYKYLKGARVSDAKLVAVGIVQPCFDGDLN
jgi:hypothetical protein